MQIIWQRCCPQKTISYWAGKLARLEWPWLKNRFIAWFIQRYGVNMSEALESDYRAYRHFNAFFTRALTPSARPFPAAATVRISPVDGAISQIGAICQGTLLQAKGHTYRVNSLLACDEETSAQFNQGYFLTAYLSPKDYHRIHMPIAGQLMRMTYVPGRLFSVNPYTADHLPDLFARNERLICYFETAEGPMAMVLVGAMIVASIRTPWHGLVARQREGQIQHWSYEEAPIPFDRGQEMGQFELGSTVILLHTQQAAPWAKQWQAGSLLQMGAAMTTEASRANTEA